MKLPGENLLIKLWETLSEKGIGSLLSPWQTRRMGRANTDVRVEEMLKLAQAEKYAEEIHSGRMIFSDGKFISLPSSCSNEQIELQNNWSDPPMANRLIEQVVKKNNLTDSIRREVNIGKALLHAEESLEQDSQELPENDIDEDWLFRWRDCASSVSSEQLQSIWGRLLAGEIKAPGSFSLRTLNFLQNLSQPEAESISKLLRFVINDMIFMGQKELLDREGINFQFLLEMQNLGVISGVEANGLKITYSSRDNDTFILPLTSNGKVLLIKHADATKKVILNPTCKLTAIGLQILRLGKLDPNNEYLHKIGEIIKSQGFDVELATYIKADESKITYFHSERI